MVHAGETCDTSQATASVASDEHGARDHGGALLVLHAALEDRREARAAGEQQRHRGVPPPSSDFEIWTGAPKFGELSHGAPVCWTWWSSVGTQGR